MVVRGVGMAASIACDQEPSNIMAAGDNQGRIIARKIKDSTAKDSAAEEKERIGESPNPRD